MQDIGGSLRIQFIMYQGHRNRFATAHMVQDIAQQQHYRGGELNGLCISCAESGRYGFAASSQCRQLRTGTGSDSRIAITWQHREND